MNQSMMEKEALSSPEVISNQINNNNILIREIGKKISLFEPKMIMLIGRGSSDNAGLFAKYLFEIETGIPTFSSALSIVSAYKRDIKLEHALVILISQSGKSPDLVEQIKMAKSSGAYCIAIVNELDGQVCDYADDVIPMHAGKEVSVAATKSFTATLSVLMHLVASWQADEKLTIALRDLPAMLANVANAEQKILAQDLKGVQKLIVLSRGLGFPIAKEIALKLKEVCGIQAEAYSSAEFLHGPIAIVNQNTVVLDCMVLDETAIFHKEHLQKVVSMGGKIFRLYEDGKQPYSRLIPLLILQNFYLDIARASVAMGLNPDVPVGLSKVTKTL
ncbi:SIS domain-containing protein [Bowmanella sp. Y26]|uniref:glucosamine-6-phosphate deaminase NagB-II n=1 Tax=Bowmanella yangjiangensis TaxID=2811230 RepID=UPI001BDDA5DE|nr:SIS domain-containing protein [Bowmanella yangjiangensis]MBT1062319.1 SIS domain-containing protein [Bowmanella yangjiangensis]